MFEEELEAFAARLLATAPAQDDPFDPVLDPAGALVDRLVRNARVIAALQADTMMVQAAMCRRAETWQTLHAPDWNGEVDPADLVAAEIGPALHLATGTAAIQVNRAVDILTRLPKTLAAMRRGDLDLGRVLAIVDATMPLSDADAGKVEADVLGKAVDQTAGELRAALRKAVIRIDPNAAEKRRKQAVKGRHVTKYQRDDGMCALEAVLSAVDTGEIYDLVDEMARQMKTDGDTRSMHERRADALVILITGRDPHLGPHDDDPPPPAHPAPPADGPGDHTDPDCPDPDCPDPDGPDPDCPGPEGPGQGAPQSSDPEPSDPEPSGLVPSDEVPVPDEPADLDERFGSPEGVDPDTAPDHIEPDHVDSEPADLIDPDVNLASESVEADASEQARRVAALNRFDRQREARTTRISELAALALSAMTRRRAPRLPWVAINPSVLPDGTVVLVGELQGYGPITHDYATHLLSTGAARAPDQPSARIPTPAQAAAHDPPDWLDRDVKARDVTCRFAGCRQPVHKVDLDHTIPHPHGPTVRENLGGLCRRHHRVKHSGCWTVHQHSDGIYEWTSTITGRGYTTYPRGTTGDWQGATTKPAARAG